jgi:hypothetical protein
MKNLTFTFMATAILVSNAMASPQWDTSSKSDRMYVDDSPVFTLRSAKESKPLLSGGFNDKQWNPTCNAYMTDREIRRIDESSGSGC